MPAKKVNIANIPKEKLEELKPLLQAQPEIVPIGESLYEIYPIPAAKLLKIISDITSMINTIKEKKKAIAETLDLGDEERREFLKVTFDDIMGDTEAVEKLKLIIKEILDGVDEEDFNNMNTGQLVYLLNKLIEVNINTLPPSVRNALFKVADNAGIQVETEANQGN